MVHVVGCTKLPLECVCVCVCPLCPVIDWHLIQVVLLLHFQHSWDIGVGSTATVTKTDWNSWTDGWISIHGWMDGWKSMVGQKDSNPWLLEWTGIHGWLVN